MGPTCRLIRDQVNSYQLLSLLVDRWSILSFSRYAVQPMRNLFSSSESIPHQIRFHLSSSPSLMLIFVVNKDPQSYFNPATSGCRAAEIRTKFSQQLHHPSHGRDTATTSQPPSTHPPPTSVTVHSLATPAGQARRPPCSAGGCSIAPPR